MKSIFTALGILCLTSMQAQNNDNLFDQAFEGMFDLDMNELYITEGVMDNPPPPVPVDGGLVILLAAGGAAGYRQYKKTSK